MISKEKKRILVICDRIPPEHSATGKIAYNIAKELAKNNEVFLVCLTSNERESNLEKLNIVFCLDRYGKYQKMAKIAYKKKGVPKLFYKVRCKLYYAFARRKGLFDVSEHKKILLEKCDCIIHKENINTIISVSNPFDCHSIAYRLKKNNPELDWYAHMMDSNRNNAVKTGNRKDEITVLSGARKVFIMPALLQDEEFCKDFKDKLVVINLPIIPVDKEYKKNIKTDKIVFTFVGMFYNEIRNPGRLLELFLKLPDNYILRLHSRGCNELVNEYKSVLGNRLEPLGYVSDDALNKSIRSSDVLINIGNTVSNQVPSKVYEYIAYGKPILNFYQNKNDISIMHLAKYSLCMTLDYNSNIKLTDITDWVEKNKGKNMDFETATNEMADMRLSSVLQKIETEISE